MRRRWKRSWLGLFWVFWAVWIEMGCTALAGDAALGSSWSGPGPREPSTNAWFQATCYHQRYRKQIRARRYLTLIDYTLPRSVRRLWVIDTQDPENRIVHHTHVNHAFKSGWRYATDFSNEPGSEKSTYGCFVTARTTYQGKYGRSLRLTGLEAGVNENARRRAIVFHPAGWATHSRGCFTLPDKAAQAVFDTVAGGSFVYVHTQQGARRVAAQP